MREKFTRQFKESSEPETEEFEGKEVTDAETVDSNPELTVDRKIIEDVMPEALKNAKEKHGNMWLLHVEDYIDLDKVLGILSSEASSFETFKLHRQELAKKTPLPAESTMSTKAKKIFEDMPGLFKEIDLAPDGISAKADSAPPIELEYDPNLTYGRYVDHSIIQPASPDESPKSYLQIGGKLLQEPATKLRDRAIELGIKMSVKDSLEIVLRHEVAHEYAHILSKQYEPDNFMDDHPFIERAEKISEPVLMIDKKSSQDGIFYERFAQSMADQIISEYLQEKGYDTDIIYALKKEVGGQDNKKLARYQEIIDAGEKHGFSTSEMIDFLVSVRVALDNSGHEEEAKKIDYNWNAAGYYAPVFDKEQLQYIIGNTE